MNLEKKYEIVTLKVTYKSRCPDMSQFKFGKETAFKISHNVYIYFFRLILF